MSHKLNVINCDTETVANGQIVKNAHISEVPFLSSKTKNMLKRHNIIKLSDYFEATSGCMHHSYFKSKGEKIGLVTDYELHHIENFAIWERVDGRTFKPKKDFLSYFINTVIYNFGFLWLDPSSMWHTHWEDSGIMLDIKAGEYVKKRPCHPGRIDFPAVNESLGLTNRGLLLLAKDIADARKTALMPAIKTFFNSPMIQSAFKAHIIDVINEISYRTNYAWEVPEIQRIKESLGYTEEHPLSFCYEDVRASVRIHEMGYPLVDTIIDILIKLEEEGFILSLEREYEPLRFVVKRADPKL